MRQFAVFLLVILGINSASLAVPVYLAPDRIYPSGHYSRDWLRERTRAQISQRWLQIKTRNGQVGWAADDHLLTREDLLNGALAFMKARTQIKNGKYPRSEGLTWVNANEKVDVVRPDGDWVVIRAKHVTGYVSRQNVLMAEDIPEKSALVLASQLPVRAESVPYSEIVTRLEKFETVQTLTAKTEDWGQVATTREGELWWPMNESARGPHTKTPLSLLSSQLFQRRLYDMAASPLNSSVKLASAQGIFRTTDGKRWTQIDQFRDQDHPIAIAPSGRIFVGPYYSDDQGLTFNEYIRWDKLISGLSRLRGDTRERDGIKILEVKPLKDSNHVSVLLDLGKSDRIVAMTSDLGETWTIAPK